VTPETRPRPPECAAEQESAVCRCPWALDAVAAGCEPNLTAWSGAIPVTDREMLQFPHCLDNRLTDGGKVVGRALLPRNIIALLRVLISVRGRANPRA
jgi:hypothetical protein